MLDVNPLVQVERCIRVDVVTEPNGKVVRLRLREDRCSV